MNSTNCRIILCLLIIFMHTFLAGCAAKLGDGGSADPGTDGQLRDLGGGEICLEVRSGRMWQVAKSGSFSSPGEAELYAGELELGGYNDWRLPTREELLALYSLFFWKKNGNCSMSNTGEFWAVTRDGKPAPGHWETYYLCGPEQKYVEASGTPGSVRAVRP